LTIISGSYKGRIITRLDQAIEQCRPTAVRVKQTVFDVLQHRYDMAHMGSKNSFGGLTGLDICAGWGSYGLEMLSRGGDHVTFVEKHPRLESHLNRLLDAWNWKQKASVCRACWPDMPWATLGSGGWNVIFLDPPYDVWEQIPDPSPLWLEPCWTYLAPLGVLVIESRSAITWRPPGEHTWSEYTKTWPNKQVLFLQKTIDPTDPSQCSPQPA
jgi:16S rRNA (guanine(966)-N(2))-methyltransferase RsmD